jgi:lipoprotein
MKKFVLSLGLIALFSCSKDKTTEKTGEDVQTVTIERDFQLPSRTEKGKLETLKVVFTAKIDKEKDELLSEEVSENLLEYLGVKTQKEFNKLINKKTIEQHLSTFLSSNADKGIIPYNFYEIDFSDEEDDTSLEKGDFLLSECLKKCVREFTDENGNKKKGRGLCKFGCYVDKIADILK